MLRGITISQVRRKALRLSRVNDRLLRDEEDHSRLYFYSRNIVALQIRRARHKIALACRSSDRIARLDTDSDGISMKKHRTIDPCYYRGNGRENRPDAFSWNCNLALIIYRQAWEIPNGSRGSAILDVGCRMNENRRTCSGRENYARP